MPYKEGASISTIEAGNQWISLVLLTDIFYKMKPILMLQRN